MLSNTCKYGLRAIVYIAGKSDKGQKIGRKTGNLVQKGVDKIEGVKQKLESDGTMDKIRDVSLKVDEKIDKVVSEVSKKTKQVVNKVKKNKAEPEDDFYE